VTRVWRSWTDTEDATLRRLWITSSTAELCDALPGRTVAAVRSRGRDLKLPGRKRASADLRIRAVAAARQLAARHMSCAAGSRAAGLNPTAIHYALRKCVGAKICRALIAAASALEPTVARGER
jgi:hypothetical protein